MYTYTIPHVSDVASHEPCMHYMKVCVNWNSLLAACPQNTCRYYVFCDCDIILLYSSYRGAKNNILRDAGSRLPVPDANGLVVRRTDNPRILLYMYNSENKNTEVNRKNYIGFS